MHERALVHQPCGCARKVGGLAQILQRGAPTWRDRQQGADLIAGSLWRNQSVTVNEARKLYPRALQGMGAVQAVNKPILLLDRSVGADHTYRTNIVRFRGHSRQVFDFMARRGRQK